MRLTPVDNILSCILWSHERHRSLGWPFSFTTLVGCRCEVAIVLSNQIRWRSQRKNFLFLDVCNIDAGCWCLYLESGVFVKCKDSLQQESMLWFAPINSFVLLLCCPGLLKIELQFCRSTVYDNPGFRVSSFEFKSERPQLWFIICIARMEFLESQTNQASVLLGNCSVISTRDQATTIWSISTSSIW
jgi:hypothetical protein